MREGGMSPSNIEQVLSRLEGVRRVNGGYVAKCPAHQDRNPSLSIKESEGKLLLFCHAGCSFKEVLNALGIKNDIPQGERVEVAHYNYTDEHGNILLQVVRYEPKGFSQRRPEAGKWIDDTKGVMAPLYNLPAVIRNRDSGGYVIFVEGEKDVETLRSYDIVGTTIRGGSSGKWHAHYTSTLEGANVAIIPDNDTVGYKHAERVAVSLYGWAKSVKMINLPDQEKGNDFTDWAARYDSPKIKLAHILNNSPEYTPPQMVSRDEFDSLRFLVKSQSKEIKRLRWKLYELAGKKIRKDGE